MPARKPQRPQPVNTPDERQINEHVAAKLREQRISVGLSQTELAGRVGVTYQQIQKYEGGTSRISAARLCSLAVALQVEVAYFFLPQEPGARPLQPPPDNDRVLAKGSKAMADAWRTIRDPAMRQTLLTLAENCIAAQGENPST